MITEPVVISEPDQPGAYVGDLWFGHSENRTWPTRCWDGEKWQAVPEAEWEST